MTTYTVPQLKRALSKVPNASDFCRRHEIPERTYWRSREPDYMPGKTTQKVLVLALEADGLLAKKAPKKKAAAA